MNVRLAHTAIRFRIAPEELEKLLIGSPLNDSMDIDGFGLAWRIEPAAELGPEGMSIDFVNNCLILHVTQTNLDALKQMGRSKDGIQAQDKGYTLTLEVDIKKKPITAI